MAGMRKPVLLLALAALALGQASLAARAALPHCGYLSTIEAQVEAGFPGQTMGVSSTLLYPDSEDLVFSFYSASRGSTWVEIVSNSKTATACVVAEGHGEAPL